MDDGTTALVNCYRLEALGNSTRLAIFRLLVRAGSAGLQVGDVRRALSVPASTLSHHLQRLVHVGLMSQERQGRVLVCRADFEAIDSVVEYLTQECCADEATAEAGKRRQRGRAAPRGKATATRRASAAAKAASVGA